MMSADIDPNRKYAKFGQHLLTSGERQTAIYLFNVRADTGEQTKLHLLLIPPVSSFDYQRYALEACIGALILPPLQSRPWFVLM